MSCVTDCIHVAHNTTYCASTCASPHECCIHVVPMYTKSTLRSTGVLCVYSVYVKGITPTCTLTVTFCCMLILLLLLITVHDCNYFNRYLVLYLDGGYYIDSDIQCIKPFPAWHDFSASGASYKEAKAIIGIEFLTPDVQVRTITQF
jgi:Glycosyltransferase sugar-binding region containing DXD motif